MPTERRVRLGDAADDPGKRARDIEPRTLDSKRGLSTPTPQTAPPPQLLAQALDLAPEAFRALGIRRFLRLCELGLQVAQAFTVGGARLRVEHLPGVAAARRREPGCGQSSRARRSA